MGKPSTLLIHVLLFKTYSTKTLSYHGYYAYIVLVWDACPIKVCTFKGNQSNLDFIGRFNKIYVKVTQTWIILTRVLVIWKVSGLFNTPDVTHAKFNPHFDQKSAYSSQRWWKIYL